MRELRLEYRKHSAFNYGIWDVIEDVPAPITGGTFARMVAGVYTESDARLLVTAPQLAAALVRLLPWAQSITHQDSYPPKVDDDIEAALDALDAAGVKHA